MNTTQKAAMNHRTPKALSVGLLLAALTAPAAALPPKSAEEFESQAEKLPEALRNVRIEKHLNAQVPGDLEFRDENGRTVRLGDYYGGKPIVLALVYYRCPGICTAVLSGLKESLERMTLDLDKDFTVLTVSFDTRDKPDRAKKKKQNYLESYPRPGAEEGWHFLTGDQTDIDRLTEAVGFYYAYDERNQQFAHPAAITLLTPEGRISGYFFGIDYPPRDLRLGLVEASQNKIGSALDQVLLFCFHYDKDTGKYTASVKNGVRLAGAVFVLLLAVMLGLAWRAERRRSRAPVATGGCS